MNKLFNRQAPENYIIYSGFRNEMTVNDKKGKCTVSQYNTETGSETPLASMTYEWGEVSRPALALSESILLNWLYGDALSPNRISRRIIQDFCVEVLRQMPHDGWQLGDSIVEAWLLHKAGE